MTLHVDYNLPDAAWDDFVEHHAGGHVLQTSAWAALKSRFGWSARRVAVLEGDRVVAGASVLFRRLPLGLGALAYIPKGPLVDYSDEHQVSALSGGLDALCRAHHVFVLKLEPEIEDTPGAHSRLQTMLAIPPSARTAQPVQPQRTIHLDLTRPEGELLSAMHQKTRYNIRLAERKGVLVCEGTPDDLPAFYSLMQVTGARDGFGVHSADYYRAMFELFVPRGWGRLFVAQVADPSACAGLIAGIMVLAMGSKAWYICGASSNEQRDRMPNHALQWAAIRWAKSLGCTTYDLWGVPDEDEAQLESRYLERGDGLWGVYRFKRGFGGRLVRYVGAFDRAYNPLLYRAYLLALQRRGGIAF